MGIESEVLPNLFKPFFTTRPEGTGLGLYFAKQLFEHFQGSINVLRTKPGKGTAIMIKLPLEDLTWILEEAQLHWH